jgi:hypothetical protein
MEETKRVPAKEDPIKFLDLPASEFHVLCFDIVACGNGGFDLDDLSDAAQWRGAHPDLFDLFPKPLEPPLKEGHKVDADRDHDAAHTDSKDLLPAFILATFDSDVSTSLSPTVSQEALRIH